MITSLYKQKKTIILIFFYSISSLIALVTYKDYGIHIEEKFHRLNGHYWLNYVSDIFGSESIQQATEKKISEISDYTLSQVSIYNKYSTIFDLPMALIEIIFNYKDIQEIYYLKHISSFFIFLLSSIFFFKILEKRYENFYLCFVGLVLYVSSPRILGDSFLYKDVLFLSFFTITTFYFYKVFKKFKYKNIIILSIFTALSINLRIFAFIIPFLFVLLTIIKSFNIQNKIYLIKKILLYVTFSILFLIIFWPYLWSNPFENFLNLFTSLQNDLINVKVFFDGEFISNRLLPDNYLIKWIFISSPIFQSVFFSLGFLFCFFRFSKRFINLKEKKFYNDLWRGNNEELDFILIFMFLFYFFLFIISNAPFYNGWRLVYFFNFFIIYFTINFLSILLILFSRKKIKRLFYLVILLPIFYNVYALIKTHPFQSIYFNSFVSEKTKNNFEGDYYGLATKHFLNKILNFERSNIKNVGVASHTPIQRGLESLTKNQREKIKIVGQEYALANYIFKNNISEVNSKLIKKYQIPDNFSKIYELKVDKVIIYEIYKRN